MKSTKFLILLFIVSIAIISCDEAKKETAEKVPEVSLETEVKSEPIKEESLNSRLGGEDGISAIVEDIVAAHLANPIVKDRFAHLENNPEQMSVFKQHVKDFFGAGTGGSVAYSGRDMPTAHKGLDISGIEFVEAISDIMMVLDKHNIDEESKKDVLYILFSFRGQVIAQ
mgnify:CR=1 FL=1